MINTLNKDRDKTIRIEFEKMTPKEGKELELTVKIENGRVFVQTNYQVYVEDIPRK